MDSLSKKQGNVLYSTKTQGEGVAYQYQHGKQESKLFDVATYLRSCVLSLKTKSKLLVIA